MPENLATALARFQGSGYAIPRLRTVTVESRKTGTSYTFDYAPHELIVAAIRKPLADCGLSVSQPLATTPDGKPGLRTTLMHTSGESVSEVFPLPIHDGMTAQELGSAITYIRRYALSAILGLATEDDDDGNRASGNTVSARRDRALSGEDAPQAPETPHDGSLIGTVEIGKAPSDFELRTGPTGSAISFRLKDGRSSIKVVALDPLASALAVVKDQILGQRVTVWGTVSIESFVKDGKTIEYRVLALDRIQTADLVLPASEPDELDALPLFEESAA